MDLAAKPVTNDQSNIERRRSKLSRRHGLERRQQINPNYTGPARRTTLDRRLKNQDRRKSGL